ncbi:MAG: DUF2959 family protein [Planctomycetes bacterium]|nr:DUF2959 family protein [Planctomycetota bacterium]
MIRRLLVTQVAILLPTVFGLFSCASTSRQAQSVQEVDNLLTRVERVQVDATVAREKARASLSELTALVSPNFSGDATKQFATFKQSIEDSVRQATELRKSVRPMTESAATVFGRWTQDLEAFGNTKMRQRSQARLDDTRNRYQGVLNSAQNVLVTLEAFNADLKDQALFLASDLNASAIASIHPEVRELHERAKELDNRVEACSNAARTYVEATALYGQVETVTLDNATPNNTATTSQTTERQTKTKFAKQRSSTLKPRPSTAPSETPFPPATPEDSGTDQAPQ